MATKLNLGCGAEKLDGWINIDWDIACKPDMRLDLSKDLPFETGSVDYIISEDFIVQLDLDGGKRFLRECRRILRPDGVMRILTPGLEKLVRAYLERPDWLVRTWETFVGVPLQTGTACEVVNLGMRMAGQFHYDESTFIRVAAECGLRAEAVEYNRSAYPDLRGLDLRHPDESVSMYFECHPHPA
jgi:predicted SAM-dependent methyltransferase